MAWSARAKRFYRLLANRRLRHRDLLKGLYAHAQQLVTQETSDYVIVALDPVNFEKPYCPAGGRRLHSHEKHPTSFGGQEAFTQGLSCHDGYHCQSVRAVC